MRTLAFQLTFIDLGDDVAPCHLGVYFEGKCRMQNQENFPRHGFREAIDLSSAKRRWVRNLKLVSSVLERKGASSLAACSPEVVGFGHRMELGRGRLELSESFLKELLEEGIQLLNKIEISPSLEAYKYEPDPQS